MDSEDQASSKTFITFAATFRMNIDGPALLNKFKVVLY